MGKNKDDQRPPSLLYRYRLVLWKEHQPYVALLLLCCLVGMTAYFGWLAMANQGLVDIDLAPKQKADFKIDINTAQWSEIVVISGIGEKLARSIVEYRQQNGAFKTLESIQNVPGIGTSKFQQLQPFLLPIAQP